MTKHFTLRDPFVLVKTENAQDITILKEVMKSDIMEILLEASDFGFIQSQMLLLLQSSTLELTRVITQLKFNLREELKKHLNVMVMQIKTELKDSLTF
jgi:hypothetical protein